jgi:DNA-nicking Smr family endonuclease
MTDDSKSERSQFLEAMAGVKRLRQERARLTKKAPRPARDSVQYRREAAEKEHERVVDGLSTAAVEIIESEQELLFASPGVQIRQMQKLRRGHIPWQAGLDLHGYTLDQAREELYRFINDSANGKLRCVLVVHGKASGSDAGSPALIKSHVNDWLRQLPQVLAFCSCAPQDGGTGALYVLLRQKPSR